MSVADLTSNIKTRIEAVATGYSEIGFSREISKNTFNGNFKRYGVNPLGAREVSSVNRYVTIDQQFEIMLSEGFINKPMSDAEEQAAGIRLQDLALEIYRDLVNTKAGSPSTCIIVSDFSCEAPVTISNSSALSLRASFNLKYRSAL